MTMVLLLVATGCSSTGAQVASDRCTGIGLDYVRSGWGGQVQLAATVASDGDGVVAWLTHPGKPVSEVQVTEWQQRGSSLVAVCYYDGDFSSFPGPEEAARNYTRLMLLIPEDGEPIVGSVGPMDAVRPDEGPPVKSTLPG
jgi:hypothetical protein